MKINVYEYANENKFSYMITTDKLKVVDFVTKDEWDYGFVDLLTKETKERLIYNKMREMVKNRTVENKRFSKKQITPRSWGG